MSNQTSLAPAPASSLDEKLTQKPPHNLAIEQALLASLMNVDDSFDTISDLVSGADFYDERHRHIFNCITHLAHTNSPYDTLAVHDALARQDLLKTIGGEEYLVQIERSTGAAFNLVFYAQKVREFAVYRNLIHAANNILKMAYHPQKQSLSEILDKAESDIFAIGESIARRQGNQGLRSGGSVAKGVIKLIKELQNRPEGMLLGLDTSFEEINNKTQGFQKGNLIILAARPSMGKTAFALNLAHTALLQNVPVVIFSMEMSSQDIMMRLLSAWTSINSAALRSGDVKGENWSRLQNGVEQIVSSKLYIDDRNNLPPSEVRSVCRKIAKDHKEGLGLIVVDYLQLMRVPGLENNRISEISEISRSLKALAREMNCPVLALSQLSRSPEMRPNKRPLMSDLRESGAIEQDADVIMFIYRDEYYNKDRSDNKGLAEIIIGKNRNGPIGTTTLHFRGEITRFENPSHHTSYEPDTESF